MEATPDTSSAKRGRAKPKIVVKSSAETVPVAAKKPRAPRKTLTTKATAAATEAQVALAMTPAEDDMGTMIAQAAYYLAAARNFMPGHELDDWLEAERAIKARSYG